MIYSHSALFFNTVWPTRSLCRYPCEGCRFKDVLDSRLSASHYACRWPGKPTDEDRPFWMSSSAWLTDEIARAIFRKPIDGPFHPDARTAVCKVREEESK